MVAVAPATGEAHAVAAKARPLLPPLLLPTNGRRQPAASQLPQAPPAPAMALPAPTCAPALIDELSAL